MALDVFQAMADPSRRQMLQLLSRDSLTINALTQHFEMSRPAVSKHVKVLQQAGFISIQTIGRERYCLLQQQGFNAVQEWMDYFDGFWKSKLKNLQTLLNSKAADNNKTT